MNKAMSYNKQLNLLGEEVSQVNDGDLDVLAIEKIMSKIEMARLCIGHKQNERAINNLLYVKKELNKLIWKLKK